MYATYLHSDYWLSLSWMNDVATAPGNAGVRVGCAGWEADRFDSTGAGLQSWYSRPCLLLGSCPTVHICITGTHHERRVHRCSQFRALHSQSRAMEWTASDDWLLLPYNHRTHYPHRLLPVSKKHKRKTPGRQRVLDTQYNICGWDSRVLTFVDELRAHVENRNHSVVNLGVYLWLNMWLSK